jgi:type I restriction enzyme S subunit
MVSRRVAVSTAEEPQCALRRFKPYPVYQDTGMEWLGEVPAHWGVKRLKTLAEIASGLAPPQSYDRSVGEHPVYGSNGLIGYCDEYFVTEETLAVGRVGASGSVCIIPAQSWVSDNALLLRKLRPTYRLSWVRYALETMNLGTQAAKNAQPIITGTFLGNQALATAPEPEQHAIAAFLDRETAKIDALAAKKEQLIALLQEKRTTLIARAVTKGLEPKAPMKDSGVEWLGQIPAHWAVIRLKNLAGLKAGVAITSERIEPDGDYPVFGGNGLRGYTSSYTHYGDFPLVGRQGALCGCVTFARGKFWASEHAIVVKPRAGTDARWLAELLRAMSLNKYSQSAAQPGLAVEAISTIPVPASSVEEQRAAIVSLDQETEKIDALVAKVRQAIDRLNEFRTTLIAAAVTGKIDVREEAA